MDNPLQITHPTFKSETLAPCIFYFDMQPRRNRNLLIAFEKDLLQAELQAVRRDESLSMAPYAFVEESRW